MKKRDYHIINPLIEPLVKTFNQCGFSTYASCQGHDWPVDYRKPYIAFVSPTDTQGGLNSFCGRIWDPHYPSLTGDG